jgi:hypothetical protein
VPELLLFAFAAGARLSSLPGALPRPVVCAAVAQRGLDAWGQFTRSKTGRVRKCTVRHGA